MLKKTPQLTTAEGARVYELQPDSTGHYGAARQQLASLAAPVIIDTKAMISLKISHGHEISKLIFNRLAAAAKALGEEVLEIAEGAFALSETAWRNADLNLGIYDLEELEETLERFREMPDNVIAITLLSSGKINRLLRTEEQELADQLLTAREGARTIIKFLTREDIAGAENDAHAVANLITRKSMAAGVYYAYQAA